MLLVLLPIAPTALLVKSMVKAERERYEEIRNAAAVEQRFAAVTSLARFPYKPPGPLAESPQGQLERLAAHLGTDLGGIPFAGEGDAGRLLIGTHLPENAETFEIPEAYLGKLPLASLHILFEQPEYHPTFPILEVVILGVVLVGLLAGWAVNRQLKINQLENDSIAMIAHELKTPVSSSRVMLESLSEGTVRGAEATRDYLNILLSENKRMHSLIENFLTHARLEGKGIAMSLGPLDISAVIKEAGSIYLPRFETAGGKFVVIAPPKGTMVLADRAAVLRILGCLLDNAIKHSLDPPEVVLRAEVRGNSTQVRVADRGPGIPQKESAKIFDKFYQIDQRLERAREGCGLGLAIARKFANSMRGGLSVSANPGGGSCFVLSLPNCRSLESEQLNADPALSRQVPPTSG